MFDLVFTLGFLAAIFIAGYLLFNEDDWHR